MVKKSVSINLIKKDRKETIDQIITWVQTIGRFLIVFVQIITLAALVYRFVLDNQLRDVHTKIKQEQAILKSLEKNEKTYKNLQDRLTVASSFSDKGDKSIKIFKDIINFAPIGMTFTNVTLAENGLSIEANVNSIYPLSIFVNSLKKYQKTDTVSIDKIENKTSSATITVGISVIFKQEGVANATTSTK